MENSKDEKIKNKFFDKKTIMMGSVWIVLIIVAVVATMLITKSIDRKIMTNGQITLGTLEKKVEKAQNTLDTNNEKIKVQKSQLEMINEQIKVQEKKVKPLKQISNVTLAVGEYTVGQDLEPGIYTFKYKLKKDAWGGDYIYVTHKGSEGTEETLGGTKFDMRVEGKNNNEKVSIKLVAGDKVYVDGSSGGTFSKVSSK